jgi:predicted dinucleotide-binding enzyme
MRIGIIGAGNIGTNCARQLVASGHEVHISDSRDPTASPLWPKRWDRPQPLARRHKRSTTLMS